ncbi:MAG: hypothetical protein Q8M80_08210 [Hydrogenophaga sp.]|uniref:hypothetical protein n=1 Tax=Hydrogenophaga sp. TaxID=1904254 RepID=UPI0025B8B905|nr:hypothetical protein [Hydrogenophaga sp.]MDO9506489.1 hypothetical protein [Hydrogenophaga sp.]MDP2985492.1 hypothetical protein [Hydrogenophaga sp.]MDP3204038.1 hypothetical protein [Hydrogenophaga sp.]MDP3628843.1 hypothetical protein [Hydrogenophaga sp.]
MTPSHAFAPVEGASFPVAIKWLATLAMAVLLATVWGARTQLAAMPLPPDLLWLAGLAAVVVVWHFLNIVFATTAIAGDTLSQGWLWRTSIRLSDIAQVKLLRVRRLDRWVAPRLVVRTRGIGNHTFHMADPAVLAIIDLLVHGQNEPALNNPSASVP